MRQKWRDDFEPRCLALQMHSPDAREIPRFDLDRRPGQAMPVRCQDGFRPRQVGCRAGWVRERVSQRMVIEGAGPCLRRHRPSDFGEVRYATAMRHVVFGVEQAQNGYVDAIPIMDGSHDGLDIGPPGRRHGHWGQASDQGAVRRDQHEACSSSRHQASALCKSQQFGRFPVRRFAPVCAPPAVAATFEPPEPDGARRLRAPELTPYGGWA
jgi:hypothetical protein